MCAPQTKREPSVIESLQANLRSPAVHWVLMKIHINVKGGGCFGPYDEIKLEISREMGAVHCTFSRRELRLLRPL